MSESGDWRADLAFLAGFQNLKLSRSLNDEVD
jgi:hypothetical protein